MAVDYARALSGIKDPADELLAGIATGQGIQTQRLARDQAQAAAEQQQLLNQDLTSLAENPNKTTDDYINMITKHPQLAKQYEGVLEQLNADEKNAAVSEATNVYAALSTGNPEAAKDILQRKMWASANSGDEDAARRAEIMIKTIEANPEAAKTMSGIFLATATGEKFSEIQEGLSGGPKSAGQMEFEALIKDFTPEEQELARLIKAGLRQSAGTEATPKIFDVGGVPHLLNSRGKAERIVVEGEEITAVAVGDTAAEVAELRGRGVGKATAANKAIDKGFNAIVTIDKNLRNINRAIGALDKGATTGKIATLFPSLRAATLELEQVQGELGLDVVSSVTFGALSERELQLAMTTALPTGLGPKELKQWLSDKASAQKKLRSYVKEQINFLNDGGTIVDFINSKETESKKGSSDGEQSQKLSSLLDKYAPVEQ